MSPYITIIVPVYGAEHTLDRCISSVLAQDWTNWELVLVDDGSKDKSGELCDAYAEKDSRIHTIHQRNSGVSTARNTGIKLAQGEYLLFLDSDDALLPGALSEYAAALEGGSCDVVIGALSVIGEGSTSKRIGVNKEACERNGFWEQLCLDPAPFGYAGGKMIRREPVLKNKVYFDPGMQSQEDLNFFLSVYGICGQIRIIPNEVYAYYYAPPKRTPPTWDFIANQLKLLRLAEEKSNLSAQAEASVQKRILSLLYTGLYTATEQGNFDMVAQRIDGLAGLRDFLQSVPAKGEHRVVAKAFAAGRYRRIKIYFQFRNRIRDIYRRLRRETHS